MFVLINDLRMFYVLDAFRYDKDAMEVVLSICGFRMEIVIHDISRASWMRIRQTILHDYYFDLKGYDWSIYKV